MGVFVDARSGKGSGAAAPINKASVTAALGGEPVLKSASYEGLVATRGMIPSNYNAGSTQFFSRSPHFATQNITSLKIAIPNFYIPKGSGAGGETGTGTTATVTASIEYPSGTFTRILFTGNVQGSIPNLSTLTSDYVNITIPKYAQFWVRMYINNAGGLVYQNENAVNTLGSGFITGTSGVPDLTMTNSGGTITTSPISLSPLAIIGTTDKPSVIIVGDSRALGVSDTTGASGNFGNLTRSLGLDYGYALWAVDGQRLTSFLANSANQRALFPYATHIINAYQYNDFWTAAGGQTSATAISKAQQFHTIVKALNKKVINITIGTRTSSTDSWITAANQTIFDNTINTARIAFNTWVRNGGNGQDGYIDIAFVEEELFNSGKWKTNGTTGFFTSDGLHENSNGNQIVKASIKTEVILALT